MNWENLEEILRISEKEFEKEVEKTQIIDLIARIERFQGILKKPDLNMPSLVGSEITPRRHKLSSLLRILIATRDRKDVERYEKSKTEKEQWKDRYLENKETLRDIRYVAGSEANHLMIGDFTIDAVGLQTPTSTEFEITAVSGHRIKINLKKIISPTTLQMLIDHPLTPVFLTVEATGAYQHGKKLGYYVSGEWDQTRGIEIRAGTMIAIMKV